MKKLNIGIYNKPKELPNQKSEIFNICRLIVHKNCSR